MKNFASERINEKINDTKVTQFIYSSRQWFSLSAIIFIIVIFGSAFIILNRATEIINHDIIYN